MKEKEIFIFTNEDKAKDYEEDFFDKYINDNFGNYSMIIAENNQSIITNEEEDAFMVMEYL
jgi:hypothetical protein